MNSTFKLSATWIIGFTIISIAVTGYFVGLQSPMNPSNRKRPEKKQTREAHSVATLADVPPATSYSEMRKLATQIRTLRKTQLSKLKQTKIDSLANIVITPEQKNDALIRRESNRAFNGAPPTIPHPINQMSTQTCASCHTEGFCSETLRIPKMSHQFLANCTQCHVESRPAHMDAKLFRENSFVGMPAPKGGPRAYGGAPPQIPHTTWMRTDCLSCHGFAGLHGIRTTHPWRTNCQQCHTASSSSEQTELFSTPKFLPPLILDKQ